MATKKDKIKPTPQRKPVAEIDGFLTKRSENEMEDQFADALQWEEVGKTEYSGMTYGQGVASALRWVLGHDDERPIQTLPSDAD